MKALMWIAGVFVVLFLMCACAAGVHVIKDKASEAWAQAMKGGACSKP